MGNMLRISKIIAIVLFLNTGLISLLAQNLHYQTVTVNGQKYYEYSVQPGEGLYAVSRTFSVSVAEIIRNNPSASSGLQRGQKLLIPVTKDNSGLLSAGTNEISSGPSRPVDQNSTFNHTVVSGETMYSISKMYNTTVDEIYRLNPGSSQTIAEGQILTIPQRRVISEVKEDNYRYHTILPKETLYSVSRTYSLKPEDVMRANPGLSVETFQIGKTIRIPFFESYEVITPYENQTTNIVHKVQKGETLYSISMLYGADIEDIERYNSSLQRGLKTNMEIIVPVKKSALDENSRSAINEANRLLSQSVRSQRVDMIRVGLLLPFLDETGRAHLRLQEYYEGFLLAVEKMKNIGANIELYVFEIGKDNDTKKLQSLLETMEMQSLNLIVGGVNDAQIKILSDFSKAYNVKYVVPFSQSNGEVLNNGNIFQVNPMLSSSYNKASSAFLRTFRNSNIIFVNGGLNDKIEFVSLLQNNLRNNKIKYETIALTSTLSSSILSLLSSDRENVIVPVSGDASTIRQIIDELKKVRESDSAFMTRLYGYPEWQTYSNLKDDYHLFGTYIFTPFFIDDTDPGTKAFIDDFRRWYDRKLMDTYPNYAMWGYDTALFFLTAMHRYGSSFEQNMRQVRVAPLQFTFNFERPNNWGGFINAGQYLVLYDTNGRIIKTDKSR